MPSTTPPPKRDTVSPSKSNIPAHLKFTLIASAVGGIASFFWAWMQGINLGKIVAPSAWAFIACLLFGTIAGFVGVYLIIRPKNMGPVITTAALCGLFWAPVLDWGRSWLIKQQAERVSDQTKKTGAERPQAMVNLGQETAKLLSKAGRMANASTRELARKTAKEAILSLSASAKTNPAAAIQIKQIQGAARRSGLPLD